MTFIRKGEDPATAAMIIIAAVLIASALVVLLAVPKPTKVGLERQYKDKEFKVRLRNDRARDNLKVRQASVVAQTWNMPEQQVGPVALANVTRLVRKQGLKLVSFRPQRRNETEHLVQLPYLLTVDGSFPAVMALAKDLEQPNLKLALNLIQIASADAASDRVTASIGLVATMTPSMKKEAKANG